MAKLHFNLDNKKYMLEFLPDNQVKIIQLENKDKFITVQYFSGTEVMDFMKYVKSLDFSSCRIRHCMHWKLCCWWRVKIAMFHGQQEKIFWKYLSKTLDIILYWVWYNIRLWSCCKADRKNKSHEDNLRRFYYG